MNKYIRLTKGLVDKGILIKEEDLYNYVTSSEKDYYISTYYYNQKQFEEFQKKKSIRGFKDVFTNKIWFDFDSKQDPELARYDLLELLKRLNKYGIDDRYVEIYYSGNKGYNAVITLNKELTPDEVYDICVYKFAKDLKTFDSSLYDSSQVLRLSGTKHPESNLYKIPLTIEQINNLTTTEIREMASNLDNISDEWHWEVASPNESFYTVIKDIVPISKSKYELNLREKAPQWRNCKWSLLQGNFEPGQRHNALLVIAATCRALGYDKDTTYYMCKSALKKQAFLHKQEEFPKDELWNNIIEETVFTDGWEGGQYTCQKEGWLKQYCLALGEHSCKDEKEDEKIVLETDDLVNLFDHYTKHFDENRILTGIPSLDENVSMTVGMPVGILAAPSVGKTSLLLNVLNNTSKNNIHSMFFSLDMYNVHVTQKLIQKFSKLDFDKLKELILNDPKKAFEYYKKVKDEMKNVHTVCKSGVTVQDMKNIILDYEKKNSVKIQIVAIDYLELISGPYSDETSNSAFNAKQLKDLSTDLGVCVIVLLQPQKTEEPDQPITSYRKIKGASLLEQCFRVVLSLYRPGFSCNEPEKDKFMGINCVKNTMGPLFSTHLYFDGMTGSVRDLNDEEWQELDNLIEEKKRQKEESDNLWN